MRWGQWPHVYTVDMECLLQAAYFFVDLLGFNESVFPGVSLLSRRRRSGLPVESAMGFGPGFRAMTVIL